MPSAQAPGRATSRRTRVRVLHAGSRSASGGSGIGPRTLLMSSRRRTPTTEASGTAPSCVRGSVLRRRRGDRDGGMAGRDDVEREQAHLSRRLAGRRAAAGRRRPAPRGTPPLARTTRRPAEDAERRRCRQGISAPRMPVEQRTGDPRSRRATCRGRSRRLVRGSGRRRAACTPWTVVGSGGAEWPCGSAHSLGATSRPNRPGRRPFDSPRVPPVRQPGVARGNARGVRAGPRAPRFVRGPGGVPPHHPRSASSVESAVHAGLSVPAPG